MAPCVFDEDDSSPMHTLQTQLSLRKATIPEPIDAPVPLEDLKARAAANAQAAEKEKLARAADGSRPC